MIVISSGLLLTILAVWLILDMSQRWNDFSKEHKEQERLLKVPVYESDDEGLYNLYYGQDAYWNDSDNLFPEAQAESFAEYGDGRMTTAIIELKRERRLRSAREWARANHDEATALYWKGAVANSERYKADIQAMKAASR
jgi:hypothetical protein